METLLQIQEEKSQSAVMVAGPLSMAMQAVKAGMSIADLRDMLNLQKEWEANEARKAYAMAMSGFKAEKVEIVKNKRVYFQTKNNGVVDYKHAELSDVTAAICPAMSKHQLSHRWDIRQDGQYITVACRITHALGHSEFIEMTGTPDMSGQKNQLQQMASTVTYLQRYTLLAITGMSTKGEDDDGRCGTDDYADTGRASADESVSFARAEAPKPPAAPAIEYCPQAKFDGLLPTWTALIESGEKTADRVITFVERKQALTDAQKATLRAIPVAQAA
jgi:hypothetical protein